MEQFNPPSPLILTGNLAENWRRWERRFGLYIVSSGANEEEEDVKKAILLHSIGEDAREVFNTLTVSSAGENATMEDILEAFREYCSPLSKDIQQLVGKDEEVLPEQREGSSSLNQEEPPEPAHIKEEQEELWYSEAREQLHGEEDIIMFTFNPGSVKTEEENGEEPQTSQLHEDQSEESRDKEHFKIEADGEQCGRSESDRDFDQDCHFPPVTPDETSDLSGSETDDSGDWEESDEPHEGSNFLQNKDIAVSNTKCNTSSSSECAPSLRKKKRQKKQKDERPFICSVCGKRYVGKNNLNQHMLRHSGEKKFSCSVCEKSFIGKVEMVRHMRVHTDERQFSCSVCGKQFKRNGALKSHSIIHTGEKPFSCSICGRKFYELGNLRAHAVVHTGEKPFSCSVCGKGFSHHGNMRRHSVVHTGKKLFSCSVCGKSFAQHEHLRAHSVIHTGEKPFNCLVCGKSFSHHRYLSAHSIVHTGEKPFSCLVCGKSFTRHVNLTRHSIVHTGKKPFSCSVCDRTFTRLQHVRKHKCVSESSENEIKTQDSHQTSLPL
ncbi:gastrula zinc finger protein XlCGF57.1-like [Cheilinus undulatus]|uniref:gastrula zinc finger protein XlCGF57.1-like n=1 Tax=Cheilinus undulatus TaxID=241271 RepID=UPI001BD433F7|nr:gastrula zinc finger protein XlCGF57.1-like [Cheilinus undulatus]